MLERDYCQALTLDRGLNAEVLAVAKNMPDRKAEIDLGQSAVSGPISRAAEFVAEASDQDFNTAILKRYSNKDTYFSKAYYPHNDPDRFKGRIALLSLDNFAKLYVVLSNKVCKIEQRAGDATVISSVARHWVTQPLDGPVRHFLFFGWDSTK